MPAPPDVQQAAVTPSLKEQASEWLRDYTSQTGISPLDLRPLAHPYAVQSVANGDMELLISGFPPPQGWFATPLGRDAAAVILHPDNPTPDLSLEDLHNLLSGAVTSWEELDGPDEPVQLVLLLETDEYRAAVEASFPSEYNPPADALLAPDPAAVQETVQQTPGALGIMPLSAVDQSGQEVRIVQIDGVSPGDTTSTTGSYAFPVDIIATAPEEPGGALRNWLSWIQSDAHN